MTVRDALGTLRKKRVLSAGRTAFVACDEDEWTEAHREDREPEPDPFAWPLEDVSVGGDA